MMKHIKLALASAMLISFSTTGLAVERSTPADCSKLKIEIQKYSDLLKGGGTEKQKRKWSLAKRDYEGLLNDSSCNVAPKQKKK